MERRGPHPPLWDFFLKLITMQPSLEQYQGCSSAMAMGQGCTLPKLVFGPCFPNPIKSIRDLFLTTMQPSLKQYQVCSSEMAIGQGCTLPKLVLVPAF